MITMIVEEERVKTDINNDSADEIMAELYEGCVSVLNQLAARDGYRAEDLYNGFAESLLGFSASKTN